jgi:hypothetical protein
MMDFESVGRQVRQKAVGMAYFGRGGRGPFGGGPGQGGN